jgi:aminopeptidase
MKDPRVAKLAKNLIRYSTELKPGENVLIENYGDGGELVLALVEEAYAAGGHPFVTYKDPETLRLIQTKADEAQLKVVASYELLRMKQMQAYVGIRGSANISEMSGVPSEQVKKWSKIVSHPVHMERRVKKTKWVVLRWPNHAMAQLAGMPTEKFEDFYFDVCNLDYAKMSRAMDPLCRLMEKTDKVRMTGVGTDISFSIKGLPPIKCDGQRNIPDGEVYTAPVKDSVNGVITYNAPSEHEGVVFKNIRLEFRNGKIVKASADNDTERLNKIFNADKGARYVGEYSLGVNPYILHPMMDTLFDEKITGSIHFTPGACYEECDNGNKSTLHWDLVLIQRKEYGGGNIWFDDRLIRKDGVFVAKELEGLNPKNLK